MNLGLAWLIAVIVFIVFEAVTYQIVSIWFAIGAVGALIAYVCGGNLTIQIIVFFIISVLCLFTTRPLAKKYFANGGTRTNADSLIDKEVLITKDVDNIHATGEGKINGMIWTVRSKDDNKIIPEGQRAIVEKIDGVKLIVK